MNNTRKLVESALMAALVGAFVIINRYTVGMLAYFVFLLPLPMVYLSYKYDAKTASMAAFGSVILTFIFGSIPNVFTVLIECVIGIVYGSGLRKKENSSALLFKVIVLAIIMNFVSFVLFAAFFGYDIVGEVQMIEDVFTTIFDEANVEVQIPDLRSYIEVLFVLSVLLTGVLEGYLTHVSSRLLLSRLKFDIAKPTPIFFHKPNKVLGYLALLLTGVFIVSSRYSIDEIWIRYGIMFIGMLGYLYLTGYGCIAAIVLIRAYIPSLRIIVVFFILFEALFMSLGLMILGFLYITTNMRETAVERIIYDSQNRSTKV